MKIAYIEPLTLIDYPGEVACVLYTVGCNFHCPYCHNPELVDESAVVHFDIAKSVSWLKSNSTLLDGVVITGGEPTIHSDLPSLIVEIKKLGLLVKLDSNGTNPEMLKRLIADNLLDYIAMDIKSPLLEYSQTVNRPVNVENIKKSITLLMSSGVPYEFRTTLIKQLAPPEKVLEIAQLIKGADRYVLQKFVSTKVLNPQFRRKTTYNHDELKDLKLKVSAYVKECFVRE